ncbi:heavy metal translocating P-type ATPase [Methylococcus mesophilus]|uniref:heavy metal translocating P-type ATPase n=1 Tax=Methylococcus mesophilus TaxID=2993564 RepID=UPI00224B724E|nr:heavy metal translocating P-type ATPase [Methylococcus mesophilus]UZR30034.1 heavy metal translocating P-type ATPase [Methylococcus mesophilus]
MPQLASNPSAQKLSGSSCITVSFPAPGTIAIHGQEMFGNPDTPVCRAFLRRVFLVPEIRGATIKAAPACCAELHFDTKRHAAKEVLWRVADCLVEDGAAPAEGEAAPVIAPMITARDRHGVVHYHRFGKRVTGWQVVSDHTGSIRLKNPVLYRKNNLCQAIERELMSILGVDRYKTHSLRCTVQIDYDPRRLSQANLIEILDSALETAEHQEELDKLDLDLTICTLSIPLAATAQFAVPALLPVSAAVFAYTSIPCFQGAYELIFKEKRIGCDFLDSIVVLGCLGTLQILPGAVLAWCLSFGRLLVKKTEDNSKKMLLNAFGKQPRYVWLVKDGVEIEVPMDKVEKGDIVAVHTGDTVPVDGHIVEGMAMIDQHALTGESTPAEKGVGDRVFASTIMVAGKIFVSVEQSGSETASSKISQILNDTAGYKLSSQNRGEKLADQAAVPTLVVGGLAMAAIGPGGAVAALNSDLGTGIRMAAPLALLSSLALCAQKGILVKDGRALELMGKIDTVLFDKTGTLTRECPEVGRVITANGFAESEVLMYAAAAEQKFHHPIALAILNKAEEWGIGLPATDETQYKVGYGIDVGVNGRRIRVGSPRFMEMEGIALTPEIKEALDAAHLEGYTMVMVAIGDRMGGALELRAAVRPEVKEIVAGLRSRGVKHLAIISGDHEAPTRKLAEELGMDRYFAQVLPADKADYVEKLQQEGRMVCFVGDGINDSIALKKANVSISLRGATSIATDTAHIVFLEQGLGKLCELRDISRELERNIARSWAMIIAPNVACVLGVFTLGFGVAASVFTNNVAALAALANGLLPMRKVALLEAERRHQIELELKRAGCANVDRSGIHETATAAESVDATAEIDDADDGRRSALAA